MNKISMTIRLPYDLVNKMRERASAGEGTMNTQIVQALRGVKGLERALPPRHGDPVPITGKKRGRPRKPNPNASPMKECEDELPPWRWFGAGVQDAYEAAREEQRLKLVAEKRARGE